ncbi:putative methyltransferase [Gordonia hirsuta DSM 44140 = NBRC 16056]|uniref:Putative methyltransferase n=1 Tax=Gordonia hirsuta DSM 44140 = NBRC 16056 TaxID=1121927 RepID=L7LBF3_9ACTN|nr:class I SAM-dependent methyltransferase [Gordonia hirsuta]GAC58056.1 putative methyltransferase [Gordonia hirsuta DSM 44140 = NBRC 16056]
MTRTVDRTAAPGRRFAAGNALGYDARIGHLVPGYAELHEISAAVLAARLPVSARILVAGAGTGTETLALAQANPAWEVVGVDPSADMLAVARRRAALADLPNARFVEGYVSGLADPMPFDAALSLLVMHFLAGDQAKSGYLAQIADRLRPGAPLLLCDLTEHDDDDLDVMAEYARARYVDPQSLSALRQRMAEDFYPVSDQRLQRLGEAAGFSPPRPYFRGVAFVANELRRS